jgi:hypothetical protein
MKKEEIDKIIKEGTIKQKIKLFFTDVALYNTTGVDEPEPVDRILTEEQKVFIFNSIVNKSDRSYYEKLRKNNKAFLMFKPNITTYTKNFDLLTIKFTINTLVRLLHRNYQEAINNIIEVAPEEPLREKLINKALESLDKFYIKKVYSGGEKPFIEIPEANLNGKLWALVETLNEKTIEAKEYLEPLKYFLNKELPLQPYKQFMLKAEKDIKANVEECRKNVQEYLKETNTSEDLDRFKIKLWEEIEVEIIKEEIEDIKRAGL